LKWILKISIRGCALESLVSGWTQVAGCCEHGYEPSGYIKCGESLD